MEALENVVYPVLGVVIFLICFGGLWLGIVTLLAWLSGWTRVARTYRAASPAVGGRFTFVSGTVGGGGVKYRRALTVPIGADGVAVAVSRLLDLRAPPLFIPWTAVAQITRMRSSELGDLVAVDLRDDAPRIALGGQAGERVLAGYAARRR